MVTHHYEADIYVSALQHAHPTRSAGNTKYGSFLLRYKFDGESEWKTPVSTKLRHTLIFTEEEVGKRIIMQAAWVNTRMLPGPWNDEVREIIN